MYDYIIIGAGPTGLTLSWYLSKLGKSVLLVEKEDSIGGCHRVKRRGFNGALFTEHGPRIYIDNYYMFMDLLKELGTDFKDIFTPYNFDIANIGGESVSYFSYKEMFYLTATFVGLNEKYKTMTMEEYAKNYKFSEKAKWYIDRLCRLTDGAGIDVYTVYQFMQIANQNGLYTTYQPKQPNDVGLFKIWKTKLEENGVDILLRTTVVGFEKSTDKIKSVTLNNGSLFNADNDNITFTGRNIILAVPPYSLVNILKNSSIKNAFGDFNQLQVWEQKVRYLDYIPIVFHWNKKLNLEQIWGFPNSDWGIAFIVLSDYMTFIDKDSKTVISTTITIHNPSSKTGKKPNQCSKQELIDETLRQLKISYPNLPTPTHALVEQNQFSNSMWVPDDNGFMITKNGYIDFQSKYENLFTCGPHCGSSPYHFNSMESAVINAVSLIHILEPQSSNIYPIKSAMTVRQFIFITSIIIYFVLIVTICFILIKTK
jgi:hypothetical protein